MALNKQSSLLGLTLHVFKVQLLPAVATGAHGDSQHYYITSSQGFELPSMTLHTYALIYPPFQLTLQRWCNHTHCDEVYFIPNLSFTAW